jgi:hypothetical protein
MLDGLRAGADRTSPEAATRCGPRECPRCDRSTRLAPSRTYCFMRWEPLPEDDVFRSVGRDGECTGVTAVADSLCLCSTRRALLSENGADIAYLRTRATWGLRFISPHKDLDLNSGLLNRCLLLKEHAWKAICTSAIERHQNIRRAFDSMSYALRMLLDVTP